jgi:hypothetical protein
LVFDALDQSSLLSSFSDDNVGKCDRFCGFNKVDAWSLFQSLEWSVRDQQDPLDFWQLLVDLLPSACFESLNLRLSVGGDLLTQLEVGLDGGIRPGDSLPTHLQGVDLVTRPSILNVHLNHAQEDALSCWGVYRLSKRKWVLDPAPVLGYGRLVAIWARDGKSLSSGHFKAFIRVNDAWHLFDDVCPLNRGWRQAICKGCSRCADARRVTDLTTSLDGLDITNLFYTD